ncbi:serine hydrolase domain-containing protein [Actinoplanes sp. NEAU-A12]|uniref:Serine hydrolase domain-containing protein n=1 Tax=Actinoplanes sandaracinus TaxID=3045177 RepID=A0ABT6X0W1_9ACTN|nr:serine hydrolase domain-containing protein [Actinoplanes sandaracinus]MDI6105642.1 serine hydrolase domain-containing protein [Actinoplanes sandaracinus]
MTTKTGTLNMTRSRRMTALVVAAAAVLTGTGVVTASAASAAEQSKAFGSAAHDSAMRDVAKHVLAIGAPGYMARINDGDRVAITAAGVADRATGRRLTGREQFEIGSNTKTFVATLVLQMVDRGQLDLDAPVSKYLPGVVPNGENITVRMLLNHTSGLFSYTSDPDFFANLQKDPQHVVTERELLDVAFKHEPNFAPGKGWSYSNTNYTLAGMILQELTGKRLPQLVQERIARPLGLRQTYLADPRATNTGPGYAHGYAVKFGETPRTYTDISDLPIGGWGGAAGAVISTQKDLSRFLSAVLGAELFSREQLKQMKTTIALPAGTGIEGSYGLGLFKIDSPCGTVWGHGGDTLGHHSTAVASADGRRTAVSDTTVEPSDTEENDGVNRYYEVAFAAEYVTICEMFDKPVPAAVIQALHGTSTSTPTSAAAK